MHGTDYFLEYYSRIDVETLENHPDPVFALNQKLELCYFNPAWFAFSLHNNGEPALSERFKLGTPVERAITGPVKDFYITKFLWVQNQGKIWQHEYECSSDLIYRLYHQTAYPLSKGKGLVLVNSLRIEENFSTSERKRKTAVPDKKRYEDKHGFITQCSHCRRIQSVEDPEVWVWIPEWVRKMPDNVSHSLCTVCLDYYYKNERSEK